MRSLTTRLEHGYCSITVVNYRLITVITFVVKSYTHPWKNFANKLCLVLHAYEILFSGIVCYVMIGENKQCLKNCSRHPRMASWSHISLFLFFGCVAIIGGECFWNRRTLQQWRSAPVEVNNSKPETRLRTINWILSLYSMCSINVQGSGIYRWQLTYHPPLLHRNAP